MAVLRTWHLAYEISFESCKQVTGMLKVGCHRDVHASEVLGDENEVGPTSLGIGGAIHI
ncbi:unnamed protein product [Prunus brigantina]